LLSVTEGVDRQHLEFLNLEFAIAVFCEPETPHQPRIHIHNICGDIAWCVPGDAGETMPTPSLRLVGLGLPGELNAIARGNHPREVWPPLRFTGWQQPPAPSNVHARSETMDDAEARLAMREIAASYERFAQRVDEHSFEADEA
jgi:hypothetical protein